MRRLPKGILLLAVVAVLIATPVLAWIVTQGNIAEVSLAVRRAEASWELVEFEIGEVNSGASFSERATTVLTVENAEMLYVSFAIYTLTEDELAALESLTVSIGEDTNDDGEIDVLWGTMEAVPTLIPWPIPFPISWNDHIVIIEVEGVAGYPEVETPIDFVIEGTCEVTPITLP